MKTEINGIEFESEVKSKEIVAAITSLEIDNN